jgi:DNA-binding transcriptional regulator of glucitol operon
MITRILLVFGIVMMVSGIFSWNQMKVTVDVYDRMKKKGKLIIGEKRFLALFISDVVALALDEKGIIKDAAKVSGMLPFRKVTVNPLPYVGNKFATLKPRQGDVDGKTAKIVGNMLRRHVR